MLDATVEGYVRSQYRLQHQLLMLIKELHLKELLFVVPTSYVDQRVTFEGVTICGG
jgi:hypothetical protein